MSDIFVSYSRREVPFVSNLVADIESGGHDLWVDYRNLVPGSSWYDQLHAALDDAEIMLLVVSEDSIVSDYVGEEWQKVKAAGKRIVLAIFQDVVLPDELKGSEWVDFRGNYKKAVGTLKSLIASPKAEMPPAPEKGLNRPVMVWVAFGLSIYAAVFSLLAAWTIWLPWMLLPLPYRIIKSRDYNFTQTMAALIVFPAALWVTALTIADATQNPYLYSLLDKMQLYVLYADGFDWISVAIVLIYGLPVLALAGVLLTPSLQRWGKPIATLVKNFDAQVDLAETRMTRSFYIEHSKQDQKIADEMSAVLAKYGHRPVDGVDDAGVVLVLVSEFHTQTTADPEKQVVYPIILQTTKKPLAEKLKRIQWIDYRIGVRHLDELGKLLPYPDRVLKALAHRPMGERLLLPRPILAVMYFWAALALFNFGACLPYVIQFQDEILSDSWSFWTLALVFALLGTFGLLAWVGGVRLVQRKGLLASWGGIIFITVAMWAILWGQQDIVGVFENAWGIDWGNEFRGISAQLPVNLYWIGNLLLFPYLLWQRKDLFRWFPAR